MIGVVDADLRALIEVRLRPNETESVTEISAWIDSGFNGDLVLPRQQIAIMALALGNAVPAILADGSTTRLDTFKAQLDWFGEWRSLDVIANDGQFPLLGTGLLRGHKLLVDYTGLIVTLD